MVRDGEYSEDKEDIDENTGTTSDGVFVLDDSSEIVTELTGTAEKVLLLSTSDAVPTDVEMEPSCVRVSVMVSEEIVDESTEVVSDSGATKEVEWLVQIVVFLLVGETS